MSQEFRVAKLGSVALIWTIGYALAFLYFAFGAVAALVNGRMPILFDAGGSILLLVLIVYGWIRAVRGYTLEGGNLTVVRNGPGRVVLPLDNITSAVHKPDIGSFFNFGFLSIGGLFGWAARVRVRNPTDLESLQAEVYGTDPKKSVVLEMEGGKTIILTPDDPQAMVTALRKTGPQMVPPTPGGRARKGRKR